MKQLKISLIKKLLFTGIALFIIILSLEVLTGLVSNVDDIRKASYASHSQVKPFKLYTKIYKPNQKLVMRSEWRPEGTKYFAPSDPIKFFTDDKGYITVSYNYSRKGIKDKIIFVGGSTTECNEVDEELRFPFLTGEILDKEYGLPFDTLNCGVRGHTTQDTINLLMYMHRYEHPIYIVMMHNINDISWLKSNITYKFYPPRDSIRESFLQLIENLKFKSNIVFLITTFLNKTGLTKERFPGDHRPPAYVVKTLDKERLQANVDQVHKSLSLQFEVNLNIFVNVCRIYGITPILMTQPLGKVDSEHEMFNQSIRKISHNLNVPLIDLDKLMPVKRNELFFPDTIHLNNEGSILVAKIIAKRLAEIIKEQ